MEKNPKYGTPPKIIGTFEVIPQEMMFYQYLPIKLKGEVLVKIESRLDVFQKIIGTACCDFIGEFGLDNYINSYVYISAKYLFQQKHCSYNRLGWHCDGFGTDDINYIWSDSFPTIFNSTELDLIQDDLLSMRQLENEVKPHLNYHYDNNLLIRLDQYNIHKVAEVTNDGFRTFIKVSISKDKYDLIGNSHNYLLDYKWDMKPRKAERNIPQFQQ